jgi:hypothetical protein
MSRRITGRLSPVVALPNDSPISHNERTNWDIPDCIGQLSQLECLDHPTVIFAYLIQRMKIQTILRVQ